MKQLEMRDFLRKLYRHFEVLQRMFGEGYSQGLEPQTLWLHTSVLLISVFSEICMSPFKTKARLHVCLKTRKNINFYRVVPHAKMLVPACFLCRKKYRMGVITMFCCFTQGIICRSLKEHKAASENRVFAVFASNCHPTTV
jgi:hypothetical protein